MSGTSSRFMSKRPRFGGGGGGGGAWTQKAEVFGIDSIRDDLRQFDRKIQQQMKAEVRKATNLVMREVRASVPDTDGRKNTGKLKKSIKTQVRGLDGRVIVDQDAWYFLVVEYGSEETGVEGREFAKKAVARKQAKAEQTIIDGLDRALDSIL